MWHPYGVGVVRVIKIRPVWTCLTPGGQFGDFFFGDNAKRNAVAPWIKTVAGE
jgi:hypothetical protein